MKWSILFLLFFSLFACDTSSYAKAYKEYFNAKLAYQKSHDREDLETVVECGKFLNFDVRKYEQILENPTPVIKKITHKKISKKPKKSRYIQIYSFNPLKIKVPYDYKLFDMGKVKYFNLNYAIVPKTIIKKFKNVTLKIAQFNKNIVRLVLISKKSFKLNYSFKNNVLSINLEKKSNLKPLLPYKKRNKIIVIDPGHGGKDSGGIGIGKRMEKVAVLKIAKYLYNDLKRAGYKVYLTRNSDYFVTLRYRTHFANRKKADLFISIHCNIAPNHNPHPEGIETYFLSPTRSNRAIRVAKIENREIKGLNYLDQRVILGFLNRDRIIASNKFAIDVQAGMLSTLKTKFKNIKDGGVRPAPFWVLVGTQMPAILIETGYLTNPREAKRLFNPTYQKMIAEGIARGIEEYLRKNR